jgi:methionyl-tRNA synthetase
LTQKYYQGKVSAQSAFTADDEELIAQLAAFPQKIGEAIESYRFREGLSLVMDLARNGNQYMQKTAPWTLYKEDAEGNAERIATILNLGIQVIANLAILSEPFLPRTAQKLKDILNFKESTWAQAGGIDLISAGQTVNAVPILFEKIEDTQVEAQKQKLAEAEKLNAAQEVKAEPLKPEIEFDDFTKPDIRVATILAAEKVAKTKKLLKITLDTGLDQRTVVSGIAEYYEPEDIIGQQVCLVANLAPRTMKGIESQGMILMAENPDKSLVFVAPTQNAQNGSVVR